MLRAHGLSTPPPVSLCQAPAARTFWVRLTRSRRALERPSAAGGIAILRHFRGGFRVIRDMIREAMVILTLKVHMYRIIEYTAGV